MYQYIAKRVLLVIPTLIGAAALVFVMMRRNHGSGPIVRTTWATSREIANQSQTTSLGS